MFQALTAKQAGACGALNVMVSRILQPYLEVAKGVLAKQDSAAIKKLKDFLTIIPSPKQIEQILGAAVLYFAETDLSVFTWLILNQSALAPELEIAAFTKKFVTDRLCDRGWHPGQDFKMTPERKLILNPASGVSLSECFSEGECLLIKTILRVSALNISSQS